MTDPIETALPICDGISYQLAIAGYFDASDYMLTDYMRGYVAATLADAAEAERAHDEKWREDAGANYAATMREAEKWGEGWVEHERLRAELAETLLQTGDLKIALDAERKRAALEAYGREKVREGMQRAAEIAAERCAACGVREIAGLVKAHILASMDAVKSGEMSHRREGFHALPEPKEAVRE